MAAKLLNCIKKSWQNREVLIALVFDIKGHLKELQKKNL